MRQKPVTRYFTLIFTLLLGILFSLLGVLTLQKSRITLNDISEKQGEIISCETGKYFKFTITGSSNTFYIYKASGDYSELKSILKAGDIITVYFVRSTTAKSSPTDTLRAVQVEKNKQIIIGKELLEGQNTGAGVVTLLAAFAFVTVAIWQFKRNKVLR